MNRTESAEAGDPGAALPPEAELLATLDRLGVVHQTHFHPAVFTVEESGALHAAIPGAHTKNLFLHDPKADRYALFTLEAHRRADIKAVQAFLGWNRLSFGKPEALQKLLGVTPGSVTPFAVMHDHAHAVTVLVDRWLTEQDAAGFHPLINTATTVISGADLVKFLRATGHEPRLIDLGAP